MDAELCKGVLCIYFLVDTCSTLTFPATWRTTFTGLEEQAGQGRYHLKMFASIVTFSLNLSAGRSSAGRSSVVSLLQAYVVAVMIGSIPTCV